MNKIMFLFLIVFSASCTQTFYVVRHGEKEPSNNNMTSDVELSAAGKQRAEKLKDELLDKQIKHIYSTNTLRTKATAQPLSNALQLPVKTYAPTNTAFIKGLKKGIKGNVLIVGHSNTVDNLVNGLLGKTVLQDLPETEYNNLFIVIKKGGRFSLQKQKYGQ